jgi:hypothetical protein
VFKLTTVITVCTVRLNLRKLFGLRNMILAVNDDRFGGGGGWGGGAEYSRNNKYCRNVLSL